MTHDYRCGEERQRFPAVFLRGVGPDLTVSNWFNDFIWPMEVNVGKRDEIISSIRSSGGFFYASEARAWITEYPSSALPKAEAPESRTRRDA